MLCLQVKKNTMKIRDPYEYFLAAVQEEARVRLGNKRYVLAEEADITAGYVSQIIGGKRRASFETQCKIAKAMGCTLDDLLERGRRILDGNPEEARAGPQDAGRLAEIIRRVEEGLEHRGIEMSANKKAAIIMWLYRHNGGASREKIEDLLGIVA